MPIRGLTDRGLSFPEIGRIRKGAPRPASGDAPGADLTYFRVVFDEQETEARAAFERAYPAEPRELNVLLPFGQIESVWDAWVEAYVAGGLVYRSDLDKVVYWVDPGSGERLVKNGVALRDINMLGAVAKKGDPVACIAAAGPVGHYKARSGSTKELEATPIGRLRVVIPELSRFAYLTFVTTSQYDVGNLSSQLAALDEIQRKAGLGLPGVPLILKRRPAMVSVPFPDGRRVRMEKWLVSIEADPKWVEAKTRSMLASAMPLLIEGKFHDEEAGEAEGPGWLDDIERPGTGWTEGQVREEHAEPEAEKPPEEPRAEKPPEEPKAKGKRRWPVAVLDQVVKAGAAPDRDEAKALLAHSPWADPAVEIKRGGGLVPWAKAFRGFVDSGDPEDLAASKATAEWKSLGGAALGGG